MTDVTVIACLAFDHRAPADGLQKFRDAVVNCPCVERTMEVCGTFDLIVQARCESLADYTAKMEKVREPLARFVARIETSFVTRMIKRTLGTGESSSLWLPCKDGRKRVDSQRIDKVVAEGDYMRVHVGDWSVLVHETMDRISKRLAGCGFVKLHRSWLVRASFIERLIHQDHRWQARLLDGSHVSVAKSHVREVMELFSGESSISDDHSPLAGTVIERPDRINEKAMKLHL